MQTRVLSTVAGAGDSGLPVWLIWLLAGIAVLLLAGIVTGLLVWRRRQQRNLQVIELLNTGASLEESVQALLNLAGPSLTVARVSPTEVRFQVLSIRDPRGDVMQPFTLNMEVELSVHLIESARKFKYSGRLFETVGRDLVSETFVGKVWVRDKKKLMTLDGWVNVDFDMRTIYRTIESTLGPLGWLH